MLSMSDALFSSTWWWWLGNSSCRPCTTDLYLYLIIILGKNHRTDLMEFSFSLILSSSFFTTSLSRVSGLYFLSITFWYSLAWPCFVTNSCKLTSFLFFMSANCEPTSVWRDSISEIVTWHSCKWFDSSCCRVRLCVIASSACCILFFSWRMLRLES